MGISWAQLRLGNFLCPKCEHYTCWLCHSYKMWPAIRSSNTSTGFSFAYRHRIVSTRHLSLRPEWAAALRVSFASISLHDVKLTLGTFRFPDMLFSGVSQKKFPEPASDIRGRLFALHREPSSLKFLCLVLFFIAVAAFLVSSLTNARCTGLLDCVRAFSNTGVVTFANYVPT